MTEIKEPGVFELVPIAVQPLVGSGDFLLAQIKFETWASVLIFLTSPDIDISLWFSVLTGGNEVGCHFTVKPSNKGVGAKALFSAFHIDIPMEANDDALLRLLDEMDGGYAGLLQKIKERRFIQPRVKETNLFENNGYFQELSRLSTEINIHLPEIRSLFSPENIEETYRLYSIESKKQQEIRQNEGRQRVLELRKKRDMVK
jgi:hypothetical protein